MSKEQVYELDKLIAPLIKERKQSIAHVYANHPDEICFSRTTMYNYINLGVFSFRNIDLPRKVKYKKRKENEKQRIRRETAIRKGRTYEDLKEYIGKNPESSIVEMDTVEGIKGGKVFLTLFFRESKLMLVYLQSDRQSISKHYTFSPKNVPFWKRHKKMGRQQRILAYRLQKQHNENYVILGIKYFRICRNLLYHKK